MEIADPISVSTSPSPWSWIATNYKLMVAQGQGRSPMTSLDAETDFKPFIYLIFYLFDCIQYLHLTPEQQRLLVRGVVAVIRSHTPYDHFFYF